MTQELIFHEIYNAYYLAAEKLIRAARAGELDEDRAVRLIRETAFSESFLYILDAVKTEQWRIIDSGFQTPIRNLPKRPLTNLERRWLAAVRQDPRMRVFEAETESGAETGVEPKSEPDPDPDPGLGLGPAFGSEPVAPTGTGHDAARDVGAEAGPEPLYRAEDFVVVDRLGAGDPYEEERYRRVFQTVLRGLREKQPLFLLYLSGKGKESRERYMPLKLEYSEKDDRFRLMARGRRGFTILNLARVKACALCGPEEESAVSESTAKAAVHEDACSGSAVKTDGGPKQATGAVAPVRMKAGANCTKDVDAGKARSRRIKSGLHTFPEPRKKKAVLELIDERNALERCMLHFADLEKVTTQLSERRYRVELLYRSDDETEILIRTLSFGPLLRAVSPPEFVELIVERLRRQQGMGEIL